MHPQGVLLIEDTVFGNGAFCSSAGHEVSKKAIRERERETNNISSRIFPNHSRVANNYARILFLNRYYIASTYLFRYISHLIVVNDT